MGNSGHERFIGDLADLQSDHRSHTPYPAPALFLAQDHINIDGFRFPDAIQVFMQFLNPIDFQAVPSSL